MIPKFVPDIQENSLQYSIFRFFTVVMLFLMMFALIWNVRETRINRDLGYKNRAVNCATLAAELHIRGITGGELADLQYVWDHSCNSDRIKDNLHAPR